MIIVLSNGRQLRGDIVNSVIIRSDLAPVPLTLEAEIRIDDELEGMLSNGNTVIANNETFRIIKNEQQSKRVSQSSHEKREVKIIALLDACYSVGLVRKHAIIKENTRLVDIYRAAGAKLHNVDSDFSVHRFSCFIGDTPSFHISRILQEEGGVVRWKSGRINFIRVQDLFKSKPVLSIANTTYQLGSDFLENHEVPLFFSIAKDGTFVHGNLNRTRSVLYSPHKNKLRLFNMSRALIHSQVIKTNINWKVAAGDVIETAGGEAFVVATAAHVFESGSDDSGVNQYSRFWLSMINQ